MQVQEIVLLLNTLVGIFVAAMYINRSIRTGAYLRFREELLDISRYVFKELPEGTFTANQPFARAHLWLVFILGFWGFFWVMVSIMEWAVVGAVYHCVCFAATCAIWLEVSRFQRRLTAVMIYGNSRWGEQILYGLILALPFLLLGVTQQFMQTMQLTGMPVAMFLLSVIMIPLAEEVGFRGLIAPMLAESFGIMPATVLSSFLFAIFHGYVYQAALVPLAIAFSFGCVACLVNFRYKSILPGLVGHIAINCVAVMFVIPQIAAGI